MGVGACPTYTITYSGRGIEKKRGGEERVKGEKRGKKGGWEGGGFYRICILIFSRLFGRWSLYNVMRSDPQLQEKSRRDLYK